MKTIMWDSCCTCSAAWPARARCGEREGELIHNGHLACDPSRLHSGSLATFTLRIPLGVKDQ
jgi:hypothetical protein